jgi:transposase
MTPNDVPPWSAVDQQTQRWMAAGVFEDMVHDLRALIRLAKGKQERPTAAIFDGRTVQSTPESGKRAGYDGYTRRKGGTMHRAADTLGFLLAAYVTPADEQERAHVQALAEAVQQATQDSVEIAYVDQGCTGDEPKQDAQRAGIELVVVKRPEAKKGFVLFPRRRTVERRFAWTTHFRRLARDVERLPETFRSLHVLAFAILMAQTFVKTIAHIL